RARLEIWTSALAMWRAHPLLGAGPDTFGLLFDRFQTPTYWHYEWGTVPFHAHSIYLQTRATRGLLGILAGGGMLAASLLAARDARRGAPAARALVPAVLGLLAGLAVAGAFGVLGIGGAALAAGALGTLASLATLAPTAGRTAPARARALLPAIAGGLARLLVLWPTMRQLVGSRAAELASIDDHAYSATQLALEAGRRVPWNDVLAANAADVLRRRADSMPDRPRTYALAESCARRAVTLAPPRLYNQSELALILLLRA